MAGTQETSSNRVFTPQQRLLRWFGVVFFCWCAFTCVLVACVLAFGSPADVQGDILESLAAGPVGVLIVASVSLSYAIGMRYVGNHPACASRLIAATAALIVLNAIPLAGGIAARRFAGLVSGSYTIVLLGIVAWVSLQVRRQWGAGEAVDLKDVPRTVSGKPLRSERALEKAVAEGTLAQKDGTQVPLK